jgi:hypothetical protein
MFFLNNDLSSSSGIVVFFLEVGDTEDKRKQHAQGPHRNVADRQEVVFASQSVRG